MERKKIIKNIGERINNRNLIIKFKRWLKTEKINIVIRVLAIVFLIFYMFHGQNRNATTDTSNSILLIQLLTKMAVISVFLVLHNIISHLHIEKVKDDLILSRYFERYHLIISMLFFLQSILVVLFINGPIGSKVITIVSGFLIVGSLLVPKLITFIINTSYEISHNDLMTYKQKYTKFILRKETNIIIVYVWYFGASTSVMYLALNENIQGIIMFICHIIIVSIPLNLLAQLVFVLVFKIKYIKLNKRLTELNISNINIDSVVVRQSAIYILNSSNEASICESSILCKIPVADFFPVESNNRKLFISKASFPQSYLYEDIEYIDKYINILLLIDFDTNQTSKLLELKIETSYENKCTITNEFFHIFIEINTQAGVVTPINKTLFDHKIYSNVTELKKYNFKFDIPLPKQEFYKKILCASQNTYIYNDLKVRNYFNELTMDNRKVVAHTKDYGLGKSSYDVNSIVNAGKVPVVISPWESNYDDDILLLIFDTLNNATNTKKFDDKSGQLKIYKYLFLTASLGFIKLIMEIGNGFIDYFKANVLSRIGMEMRFVFFTFFTIVFLIYFVDLWKQTITQLLLFKKNGTHVHKDFYIDHIVEMLDKNQNYVLVIEDVDRLEPKVINEVFRIISSINSKVSKQNRYFALLSYSTAQLNEKLKDTNLKASELTNKVVGKDDWGVNYSPTESMHMYCIVQIRLANLYLNSKKKLYNVSEVESNYNKLNNYICSYESELNFRDLYAISSQFISCVLNTESGQIIDLEEVYIAQIKKHIMQNIIKYS